MENQDYYEVLGVGGDADPAQIKDAFRKLAFAYHPDRNTDHPEAAEKMKSVNEAYAVLSNPAKRREYDRLRQQYGSSAYNRFRNSYSEQDIFSGSDVQQIFEEMARSFGLRGFDEIFKEFYGKGGRTFTFNGKNVSGKGFVFFGGFGSKNRGRAGGMIGKAARSLLGKAGFPQIPAKGEDIQDVIQLSPTHARVGGPYAYEHRKKSKKLVVKIPPGIQDGQKIRLTGMGNDGKWGGPPGDMYLKVRIRRPLLSKIKQWISGPKM